MKPMIILFDGQKHNNTQMYRKLMEYLREISDDEWWIETIQEYLKYDETIKELLNYIKNGHNSKNEILYKAIILNNRYEKGDEKIFRILTPIKKEGLSTELEKILYDYLIKISDEASFLSEVFSMLNSEEVQLSLLDYLIVEKHNKNEVLKFLNKNESNWYLEDARF